MNQSYAHVNAPFATLTHVCHVFRVQLYKNNARMYFCVIWVSSVQIACNMRVVYTECMNLIYAYCTPFWVVSKWMASWGVGMCEIGGENVKSLIEHYLNIPKFYIICFKQTGIARHI